MKMIGAMEQAEVNENRWLVSASPAVDTTESVRRLVG